MSEEKWEVVAETSGSGQAEILRGLLEAQGITVVLSQEGVGKYAYAATVGTLGDVQVLVPTSQLEQAQQVLNAYQEGFFEEHPVDTSGIIEESPEAGEPD